MPIEMVRTYLTAPSDIPCAASLINQTAKKKTRADENTWSASCVKLKRNNDIVSEFIHDRQPFITMRLL